MEKSNKRLRRDGLILGAALFSMFFGAGNMIFPPFLGLRAGDLWEFSFLCYFLGDIGLAMLAMFALIRSGGPEGVVRPLGKRAGTAMLVVIGLNLGMIIAVPRAVATAYELSVIPLFPNVPRTVFCGAFLLVVLSLCFTESSVVDFIGKMMTPLLFMGLVVLIYKGIRTPLGVPVSCSSTETIVATGFAAGCQTMDVFAALYLGYFLCRSAAAKGYTSTERQAQVVGIASIISGASLFIIYIGLSYLGATMSSFSFANISHTELFSIMISRLLPGMTGTVFFSIVVLLACIATSTALISSTASFFAGIVRYPSAYRILVCIISAVSILLACMGVENIIHFASIVLKITYPPVFTLVILNPLGNRLSCCASGAAAYGALAVGILSVFPPCGRFLAFLPFSSYGFGWVLPAMLCCLLRELYARYTVSSRTLGR